MLWFGLNIFPSGVFPIKERVCSCFSRSTAASMNLPFSSYSFSRFRSGKCWPSCRRSASVSSVSAWVAHALHHCLRGEQCRWCRSRLPISNCAGDDPISSIGVLRYSSSAMYGSHWLFCAFFKRCFTVCAALSACPLDCA